MGAVPYSTSSTQLLRAGFPPPSLAEQQQALAVEELAVSAALLHGLEGSCSIFSLLDPLNLLS